MTTQDINLSHLTLHFLTTVLCQITSATVCLFVRVHVFVCAYLCLCVSAAPESSSSFFLYSENYILVYDVCETAQVLSGGGVYITPCNMIYFHACNSGAAVSSRVGWEATSGQFCIWIVWSDTECKFYSGTL